MLIVLLDESGLFVFPSIADAVRAIEPFDASEIRAAFDDSAVPYRVEWIRPNRESGTFLRIIQPGQYCLVPAGPPDPCALVQLISAHPDYTNPPEAKAYLNSLLAALPTKQVQLTRPGDPRS